MSEREIVSTSSASQRTVFAAWCAIVSTRTSPRYAARPPPRAIDLDTIDDVVCSQAVECFEQPEWVEIMEADGVRFEDGETVEMLLDSLRRGLTEKNAAMAYQVRLPSAPQSHPC